GQGLLAFEDADVVAGNHYAYRLAVPNGDQTAYLGEVGIDVPTNAVLAFLGARLDPRGRHVVLAFSVATRDPVRIDLLDVAGRRVLAREIAPSGAGPQTLDLGSSAGFRSGIYLVRITQSGRKIKGKVAIVN